MVRSPEGASGRRPAPTARLLLAWLDECHAGTGDLLFLTQGGGLLSTDAAADLLTKHVAAASKRCRSRGEGCLSMVRQLEEWGYEVNLYAVPQHGSFLQAVLLGAPLGHRRLQHPGVELLRAGLR